MKSIDAETAAAVGLIAGLVCGFVPLIMGIVKRQIGMGITAFVACTVSGFCCGLLLAVPVAAGWTFWIWYKSDPPGVDRTGHAGLSDHDRRRERSRTRREQWDDDPEPAADKPFTEIGHVIVCNACRHSTSKDRHGDVPSDCPNCGEVFVHRRKRRADRSDRPLDAGLIDDDPSPRRPRRPAPPPAGSGAADPPRRRQVRTSDGDIFADRPAKSAPPAVPPPRPARPADEAVMPDDDDLIDLVPANPSPRPPR